MSLENRYVKDILGSLAIARKHALHLATEPDPNVDFGSLGFVKGVNATVVRLIDEIERLDAELKAKDSKVSELEMLLTAFLNGFDTLNRRHDEELNDIFCPLMSQTIKALKGKAAVPTNALPQETAEPKGTENT